MATERPTFSESWYRVAELRPRLRATVQVHRQHFRGQMWHVLQDMASNQYFRLNSSAYRFVALLDGRRTVAEVWNICNDQLGDSSPTQGEAIQILGQLYTSNLLRAELPPDAEGLLQRYRKRRTREIQGYLTNLLFMRIPVLDPDRFLDRWVGVFGKVFTWPAGILWLMLLATAGYFLIGRASELGQAGEGILSPENLPMLYLGMVIVKVIHEFGHSFACKRFGRIEGGAGEVHVMGVMLLVFTPLPYMDASSAWAFRSKWRRVVVGAAGMIVELAVAAVAAIVWAHTDNNTPINALCYNMMFIAGVSSLLFNGNPLLRFDAYYILSDLVEIPNLSQRSKDFLYYLVKRYIWGVKQARNPAHSMGERIWFVCYGLASTAYRMVILLSIILFLSERLPPQFKEIAMGLAAVSGVMWLCVPVGKLIRYLATSGELHRVRPRAVITMTIAVVALVGGIGLIPAPDRFRVEGVVEPESLEVVWPRADGFVSEIVTPSWKYVRKDTDVLIRARNYETEATLKILLAQRAALEAERRGAKTQNEAASQSLAKAVAALDEPIAAAREKLANLAALKAPIDGQWISPHVDRLMGVFASRNRQVGMVVSDDVLVRVVVGQDVNARAYEDMDLGDKVEIRVKGRGDLHLSGTVVDRLPAGSKQLPSKALGYAVGGSVRTQMGDAEGLKADEDQFFLLIKPEIDSDVRLLSGQRVVVRASTDPKPLAVQWFRSLLQVLQKRSSL